MARVSLLRQVGRLCSAIIGVHVFMTGSITLFSRLSTDKPFEEHWEYSTPVLMRRRNYFRFWERSFYAPVLAKDERACLEAWLSFLSLESPPLVSQTWSPRVIMQDTIAMLDGLGESRDGVYALSHCMLTVSPFVREIRRERQDDATFVHCKVVLDVAARVPFTSYTFTVFRMPTTTTLQLQRPSYSPTRLHISAAEHRWWGGRIWSAQTGSVRSPWGDIGDLVRRYNGFMMSTMMTKQATMQERAALVRARAKKIDQRVKATQERQVAALEEDHNQPEAQTS